MQAISMNAKLSLQRLLWIAPFFLWGTAMVAMKGVMPQTSPLFLGALRIMPAGLLVLMATMMMGRPQPKGWRAWGWISLFALVDGTLFQGFLVTGLARTGAGLGSVMIDSQPLAVALLAWLLYGEQVQFWGWLGLWIGIAGISCIGLPDQWLMDLFGGNWAALHLNTPIGSTLSNGLSSGESWMLMAALSMAVGTVMIRRVSQYADPIVATGWHMVIGGLSLLIGSLLWETHQWQDLALPHWLSIGYSTVFGSAIAYGLFFWFASKENLTSLSALTFLTPVFALIFSHWFLAEVLSPIQFLGVCLTLISIYLVNQRDRLSAIWQNWSDPRAAHQRSPQGSEGIQLKTEETANQ